MDGEMFAVARYVDPDGEGFRLSTAARRLARSNPAQARVLVDRAAAVSPGAWTSWRNTFCHWLGVNVGD